MRRHAAGAADGFRQFDHRDAAAEADKMSGGDRFTADKLTWVEAVTVDQELPLLARVVACLLATRYLHRDRGEAWPGTGRLASDLGRSGTQIRAALRDLERAGHLEITVTVGGKGQTNRFRPLLKPSGNPNPSENQTLRFSERNPAENRAIPFGKPQGNPYEEPIEEPDERESPPSPSSTSVKVKKADALDEADFEAFWLSYPLKKEKGAARRAFAKAITRVDVGTLVTGAQRYAEERRHEDPKYTKHPSTWLNKECWADEPKQVHVLAANDASGRDRPARSRQASTGQSYAERRFQEAARSARTEAEHDASFHHIEGEVLR